VSPAYPAAPEPPPNTAALYALDDGEPFEIGELFATLLSYKWLILSISTLAVLTGGVFAYTATPIYRADGLLQVEQQAGLLPGLDALETLTDTAPPSPPKWRSCARA
jgi:tyrosine-protein kinase Etk/Wzc